MARSSRRCAAFRRSSRCRCRRRPRHGAAAYAPRGPALLVLAVAAAAAALALEDERVAGRHRLVEERVVTNGGVLASALRDHWRIRRVVISSTAQPRREHEGRRVFEREYPYLPQQHPFTIMHMAKWAPGASAFCGGACGIGSASRALGPGCVTAQRRRRAALYCCIIQTLILAPAPSNRPTLAPLGRTWAPSPLPRARCRPVARNRSGSHRLLHAESL